MDHELIVNFTSGRLNISLLVYDGVVKSIIGIDYADIYWTLSFSGTGQLVTIEAANITHTRQLDATELTKIQKNVDDMIQQIEHLHIKK